MVPISPPKTIADLGLSRPTCFANKGVKVITKIDFTKPAAMLNAITSLLAPIAEPLTGPTTKVTVPAPIVVMSLGSSYPKAIATNAPMGALVAIAFGYEDPKDITTIGAGTVTFVVGPVSGSAIGASSDVIALSIAAGLVKSILVMTLTPLFAKQVGLDNPKSAMVFGGLMGTNSGVAAGLAAVDPKLVPYGAMTATFYTAVGCLLVPSVLFLLVDLFF